MCACSPDLFRLRTHAAYRERRAALISDPVERLRYLRRSAEPPPRVVIRLRVACILAAILAPWHTISDASVRSHVAKPRPAAKPAEPAQREAVMWPVESTPEFEIYSNGLRIENTGVVANFSRRYPVFDRRHPEAGLRDWRNQPAGIVFHTTESEDAPFEPARNGELKRIGRELLEYVRERRAYHFLIDRFGRVHRVVRESDSANHAGNSIWADSQWIYLNLNSSFLGVAFEARTDARPEDAAMNEAQAHSGRLLTEILRSKYGIRESNCVTHAQVSVNPENMRIGYHTDWAARFPFSTLGLPDNYAEPLPSLYLFGFGYDSTFIASTGGRPWAGVIAAEQLTRDAAVLEGLSLPEYQRLLQKRYLQKRKST